MMELDKLKQGNEEKNHSARRGEPHLREVTPRASRRRSSSRAGGKGGARCKLKALPQVPIPGTKGGTLVLLMDDQTDQGAESDGPVSPGSCRIKSGGERRTLQSLSTPRTR